MEQLFGAIPGILERLEPNLEIDAAVVFATWAKSAGELLRTRTCPLKFSENRLVIAVQDETWRRHLEDLSPQMLVKLNGILGRGTVKFIEFFVDQTAIVAAKSLSETVIGNTAAYKVSPSLEHAASAIDDEHLRESFLQAASTYLAKQERLNLKR